MDAIVAVYSDWGIGAGGTQPVVLHADRAHFRALTDGAAVIVGRATLADFPGGRPLKGRRNIVLTRQDIRIDGAEVVHSAEEAVAAAGGARCLVIGGESVYRALLDACDTAYVTRIDAAWPADSFFPDLDRRADWYVAGAEAPLEHEGLVFRYVTYRRRP